jgi:nucleoside 2-deoxyribosyltransferase
VKEIKIYLSGHIPKKGDGPEARWRAILIGKFNKYVKAHYKDTKVYPLPPIDWIHPLSNAPDNINAARDRMLMNSCDIAVVYLNLDIGKCLGTMWEMGYLNNLGVPVLLIEHTYNAFIHHNADVTVKDLDEAAQSLYLIVKDIREF